MTANWWEEFWQMSISYGAISVLSLILAVIFYRLSRSHRPLHRWRIHPHGWNDLEVFGIFFLFLMLNAIGFLWMQKSGRVGPDPQKVDPEALLWIRLFSASCILFAGYLILWIDGRWQPKLDQKCLLLRISQGLVVFVLICPLIMLINQVANLLLIMPGEQPDEHPLSAFAKTANSWQYLLIGISACLVAPIEEEFLFRGLLIRWASERSYRPWLLMAIVVLLALISGNSKAWTALLIFSIILLALVIIIQRVKNRWRRFPVRMLLAVHSSAAFFALMHGGVWPTPVPLYFLGLILGLLTAWTGSISASVICHAVFNSVSFLYLLRSQSVG